MLQSDLLQRTIDNSLTGGFWIICCLVVLGLGLPLLITFLKIVSNIRSTEYYWYEDTGWVFGYSFIVGMFAAFLSIALIIPRFIIEGIIK